MGAILELKTADEFFQLLDRREPCLVKFSVRNIEPSCGISPTVTALAEKLQSRLPVYAIFHDDTKAPFDQFMIEAVPCLVFFKEGREVYRLSHAAEDLAVLVMGYFGIKP